MNSKNLIACVLTILITAHAYALPNNDLYPLPSFENNWTANDLAPLNY